MYKKIELPLLTIEARPLTVGDFIEHGLNFQLFQQVSKAAGIFGQVQEQGQEETKQKIKPEMMNFINLVLSLSVKNYHDLNDRIKKIECKIGVSAELYAVAIFNRIIELSTTRFHSSKLPDRDIVEVIHFVSKTYHIEPWEMLNMSLDRFLFNEYTYSVGMHREIRMAKRAEKQGRR